MSIYRISKIIPTLLLCMVTIFLSSCSNDMQASKQSEEKTQQDVILTFWFDNANPLRTAIWEELIAVFESEHPHIHIEYEGFSKDVAKMKFDSAIAMDESPDVASIYTSWIPEFTYRNALLPLDPYVAKWDKQQDLVPSIIQYNRSLSDDEMLYGLPYTQNLDVLWVRTDWLEQHNITEIETWDDFFHTVEAFTNKEQQQYGFSIRGGEGSSLQLQRMMYAYSGIENYMENGQSTIDDPLHIEFLKKYLALYDKNTSRSDIVKDYQHMLVDFDMGTVGMIQHNIGSFSVHRLQLGLDQFKAIPLPRSLKGNYVAEAGNTMDMVMFHQTEHPEEAWEFLSFMASQKGQSLWNEEVGQLPTNEKVLQEQWVKNSPQLQTAFAVYNDPNTKLYEPPFYLIAYNSIRFTIVEPGLQEVLNGTKTVEQFLKQWSDALEYEYAQYKKYNDS